MANAIELSHSRVEELDRNLVAKSEVIKDTKGRSDSWTRVYLMVSPEGKLIKLRLWYDHKTRVGTLKVRTVKQA